MKICVICGKSFTPKAHVIDSQKVCSTLCRKALSNTYKTERAARQREHTMRTCPQCGITFIPTKKLDQKFCTSICEGKFNHKKSYEKYLANKYDGNRELALINANYKCELCNSSGKLHVHHKDNSGQTDNPNHELSNLIVVCKRCHPRIHLLSNPLKSSYKEISKEAIEQAIAECKTLDDAAAKLDITRSTLRRKRKLYGLEDLTSRRGKGNNI